MATPRLEELLTTKRILVCIGTGGVGKTTLSAALGLEAARRGRRAVVLTIDPARRLADALGVEELGNQPRELPRERLRALGVPEAGYLSALMLDMKRTFDDLVERFADSPETRDRILRNRIYQHVSDALAGSAEYSAMEKVFELTEREDFDLIVVDTPPSQHALDFLEAPRRLLEFLDSALVQRLLHPAFAASRLGFRLFHHGTEWILRLIERVSGFSFLEEISEFLLAFEGMAEGFRNRAHRVQQRLLGPEASFVLAATPARESVRHALTLLARVGELGVPLGAVILNRVRRWPGDAPLPDPVVDPARRDEAVATLAAALRRVHGPSFPAEAAADAALRAAEGYAALVASDERATEELVARAEEEGACVHRVAELPGDVHDLEGLAEIADRLFRSGAGAGAGGSEQEIAAS